MFEAVFRHIVRVFGPTPGEITDTFSESSFPASRHLAGSITPITPVLGSRFGGPVAAAPVTAFRVSLRIGEVHRTAVVDLDRRERILRDFRRQELEFGRVVRIPNLDTL